MSRDLKDFFIYYFIYVLAVFVMTYFLGDFDHIAMGAGFGMILTLLIQIRNKE